MAQGANRASLWVNVVDLKHVRQDSDHFPFHDQGVPFLFFYSGDHSDYHRVTDHADLLAYEHMAQVARLAAHVVLGACERPPRRAP